MPSKSEFTKSGKARRVVLSTKPATPETTTPVVTVPEAIPVPVSVAPLNPRLHNIDPITGFALPRETTISTTPEPETDEAATLRAIIEPLLPAANLLASANTTKPTPSFAELGVLIAGLNIPNVQPAIVAETTPVTPNTANDRALAKAAAAKAVAAFYSGRSLPFKAASELKRKSPINFALTRDPSERSAALLATILTYCHVEPGSLRFVRGSGAVPGRLLGFTGADATRIFNAGPESGGLSNCLPDRITYISGPLAGPGAESAVFALNYNAVKSNLTAFNAKTENGEHIFSAALGLLDLLHNAAPVTSGE